MLYLGANGSITALNITDGSLRWQTQVRQPGAADVTTRGVVPQSGHAPLSTPLVVNGVLMVWADATLIALSSSDGSLRWQAEVGYRSFDALTAG